MAASNEFFTFVAPDKRVKPGSVIGGALTSLGFQDVYLIDGRPSYPYRGTFPVTVMPDVVRTANVYGVCRHLIPEGATVTINGVVVTIPPWGRDGIAVNAAEVIDPGISTGGAFSVSVSAGELIGDLWVGEGETINTYLNGRQLSFDELMKWEAALAPYWDGYSEVKTYSGSVLYGTPDYLKLAGWRTSTKKGSEPSFVVYDGEALLCFMDFQDTYNEKFHFGTVTLIQIPNGTW